jgi:hypothetical protein
MYTRALIVTKKNHSHPHHDQNTTTPVFDFNNRRLGLGGTASTEVAPWCWLLFLLFFFSNVFLRSGRLLGGSLSSSLGRGRLVYILICLCSSSFVPLLGRCWFLIGIGFILDFLS